MSKKEIKLVLNKNKLLDGNIWTLPIVLPIKKKIKINKNYNLLNTKNKILCSIKVDSIFNLDNDELIKKWFSTDYLNHPGIKSLRSRGKYFISGKITRPQFKNFTFQRFEVIPKKSKELIYLKGWQTVIGFHTRNIPHQGHIFIQKRAIKQVNADGIMLSPTVGLKKKVTSKMNFLLNHILRYYNQKFIIKRLFYVVLIYTQDMQVREKQFSQLFVEKI